VEPAALERLLEAVNLAPSAGNLQGYDVVVVREPGTRAKLVRAALRQGFLGEAPVVLVFCANARRSGSKYGARGCALYAVQDATVAAAYAQLAAVDLGLGSVWVGAFDENRVGELLGTPPYARPVALLAIGHPAERPAATPRRDLADLVHHERF
jgi:nitroreductase